MCYMCTQCIINGRVCGIFLTARKIAKSYFFYGSVNSIHPIIGQILVRKDVKIDFCFGIDSTLQLQITK